MRMGTVVMITEDVKAPPTPTSSWTAAAIAVSAMQGNSEEK